MKSKHKYICLKDCELYNFFDDFSDVKAKCFKDNFYYIKNRYFILAEGEGLQRIGSDKTTMEGRREREVLSPDAYKYDSFSREYEAYTEEDNDKSYIGTFETDYYSKPQIGKFEEYFVTIAQWRDSQIDNILND
jgi:hypothetical protein